MNERFVLSFIIITHRRQFCQGVWRRFVTIQPASFYSIWISNFLNYKTIRRPRVCHPAIFFPPGFSLFQTFSLKFILPIFLLLLEVLVFFEEPCQDFLLVGPTSMFPDLVRSTETPRQQKGEWGIPSTRLSSLLCQGTNRYLSYLSPFLSYQKQRGWVRTERNYANPLVSFTGAGATMMVFGESAKR